MLVVEMVHGFDHLLPVDVLALRLADQSKQGEHVLLFVVQVLQQILAQLQSRLHEHRTMREKKKKGNGWQAF